jgi:hypothetical protein
MATRRKPRGFKSGGAVIADASPIIEPPAHTDVADADAAADIPSVSNESADAMVAALEAQRRAERMAMQQ